MAKNKNRLAAAQKSAPLPQGFQAITKRGWKVIASGAGVVVVGFIVLSLTDPGGQNWASTLSPFLILGGYATIALGIIQD